MLQFKIHPAGLEVIKKKGLIKTIPFFLVFILFMLFINTNSSENGEIDYNTLKFTLPIALIAVGMGGYIGIKRQMNLFSTYSLTFSNNKIKREQLNTPTIEIPYQEVTQITKSEQGGFIIQGKNSANIIYVPQQMEHYQELEQLLQDIKPIHVKTSKSILEKYGLLFPVLMLLLMATFYTAENIFLFSSSGILIVFILLWSFYKIRTGKNYDSRTKRFSWITLLVVASIIAGLVFRIGERF